MKTNKGLWFKKFFGVFRSLGAASDNFNNDKGEILNENE